MTLKTSEYPTVALTYAEQTQLYLTAAAEAGPLATANYVDLYVDMAIRDGHVDANTRNRFTVHGMGEAVNRSVLIDQDPAPAGTQCAERVQSCNQDAAMPPHDSWLTRQHGRLYRVHGGADGEGTLRPVSAEPASPDVVKDMLAAVRADSRSLPDGHASSVTLGEGMGHANIMLVPAQALVPAVAELTASIGGALLGGLRERQMALLAMRYNIGASGRVYGDWSWQNRPHAIELDVSDGVARKRAQFALSFRHGQVYNGAESAFMSCKLKTSRPELPTVTERLGMHNNDLVIVPDGEHHARYRPAGNGLSDLLDKALQVLKRA